MTTPNIEELIDRLRDPQTRGTTGEWFDRAVAADLLQSQAERIKELEGGVTHWKALREAAVNVANDRREERDTLRAQLAAIQAQEPVLVVEKEPDYWSVGHFHEGSKPHIKPTKVWCLPIGTKLFTRPMPAQDVEASMIKLHEPDDTYCGVNYYTESQLKQAVRDALDALKDVAQTLAWMQHGKCRGFSDGLLTTDEALDKARTALAKYKGAK